MVASSYNQSLHPIIHQNPIQAFQEGGLHRLHQKNEAEIARVIVNS